VPQVACVQMDGGRYQFFDRQAPARNEQQTFWREMKVGCLWSMTSETSAEDPCPQVPDVLLDPQRMQQMVREIKGFSGPDEAADDADRSAAAPPPQPRPGRPQPLARSVVATRRDVTAFGTLLASEAHQRGFAAAGRKAFLGDGSEANWGVWRNEFSDYEPILDLIHAVTYVYAAAMCGRPPDEGWRTYCHWIQLVWSGRLDEVLAALELAQQALGQPTDTTSKSDPAAVVATACGYLRNQASRMHYPQYRRQGLPITSAYVESTVKQINRRIKGTEKFWSHDVEGMLTLVADHLSDTPTLAKFWRHRAAHLTGTRAPQTPGA